MGRKFFSTLLIAAVVLGVVAWATESRALAAPADNVYNVCDVQHDESIGGKRVTVRAMIANSVHLGFGLADNSCTSTPVRIIFPIPDPKGIQQKFRSVERELPANGYFICDCSGIILFKRNDFPELHVDDAMISVVRMPEKTPRK